MRTRILCNEIVIKGTMTRTEIVQTVLNIFIGIESNQRGRGMQFWYPVENLSIKIGDVPEPKPIEDFLLNTDRLFIKRPGGLQKWNFDFKVIVTFDMNMARGTHADIVNDILNKKQENGVASKNLLKALEEICNCTENDVDKVLGVFPDLMTAFKSGAKVDVLLKVLKWMFIMEDIVYWNYDGRMKLFSHIKEQMG